MPQSGGCERRRTEPFVAHLNDAEGTRYSHERCLDVGPTNRPQPEALYTDPDKGDLVIERKSMIWPADYAARHRNDHLVAEWIIAEVGEQLHSAPYRLDLPNLIYGPRSDLERFACSVGQAVMAVFNALEPGAATTGRTGSWGWRLRRERDGERDPDEPATGLVVEWSSSTDYLTPEARAEARAGLAPDLRRHLESCVRKFEGYERARRVLLLERVGEFDPAGDDWAWLLTNAPPTPEVDEIWVSECYTGSEEFWSFSKVFPAPTTPA
jgi:hypothetical protein